MNIICRAIVFLLLFTACKEQNTETAKPRDKRVAANQTEENIYRSGDSMLNAFKRKDWMTFVKYNHPNMTERMGGADAFVSFIKMQMKQIPDTTSIDITLGKILQVVKTPKDQQCVVEQIMQMQQQGITLDKTTYLVGESLDAGNTWTFFDATTKSGVSPKDIKPDLSTELKIPPVKNEIN